jgi:ADP-ribose pyrophosphatase YjhB (NUDIX family)
MPINYPGARSVIQHPDNPELFLLMKQYIRKEDGSIVEYFSIPGGRVDADPETKRIETFEQAAIREAKEETDLEVELVRYLGSYGMFWGRDNSGNSCSYTVFLVRALHDRVDTTKNPDTNEDTLEMMWITKDQLSDYPISNQDLLSILHNMNLSE